MQIQQFPLTGSESGYWFVSQNGRIWLPGGDIPCGSATEFKFSGLNAQPIGMWEGKIAWLVCHEMPHDMCSVRQLLSSSEDLFFQLAGRAVQLSEFYRSHKFCGYCGETMRISQTEWCCLCDNCRQRYYPQISPSIIVAIRHQNKILLANHARHRQDNLYTVLAGFVEVGETLESAVEREVFEESQIKIKNIRYVSSQPWPFPNSIMMAYLADYKEGDIEIDKNELVDANWYHYEQLPKLPPYGTIARRLIEDTVVLCRQYDEFGD